MISYGFKFIGSPVEMTSTLSQEVVPSKPEGWTDGYSLYNFCFYNKDRCSVSVNGANAIFLYAGQGFESKDVPVQSFIVIEQGIRYSWIGAYK